MITNTKTNNCQAEKKKVEMIIIEKWKVYVPKMLDQQVKKLKQNNNRKVKSSKIIIEKWKVYVLVIIIVAHMLLQFMSSNSLNAIYDSGISFLSNFIINWQMRSFKGRFSRLNFTLSFRKCVHKLWILRCIYSPRCSQEISRYHLTIVYSCHL